VHLQNSVEAIVGLREREAIWRDLFLRVSRRSGKDQGRNADGEQ
jgi:hypothetical protein